MSYKDARVLLFTGKLIKRAMDWLPGTKVCQPMIKRLTGLFYMVLVWYVEVL